MKENLSFDSVFVRLGGKLGLAVGWTLRGGAGQALCDGLVDAASGAFRSDADGILDGVRVRRAMADDGYAFQPKQRRASVLGVIEPSLEVVEGFPREQIADLARDGLLQRLFHHRAHRRNQSLGNL